jgi:putative CocE/NonD family hydrolase
VPGPASGSVPRVQVVTEYPRSVRTIEHAWITLADGCRLAARIWLPEDAEEHPVPAIFEHLPYRLSEGTAVRDSRHYPYLAGHGYACVRTDQRGAGESDGLLLDEYLPQEQLDACEVIAWIAEQPWCTGAVGMTGISWSGFNSLQVAARRPPALRAIVTLCSTDDRYADDVHYDGGCISSDMLQWSSSMFTWNARPPDPELVGERWREMWLDRMQNASPFGDIWLAHQRRDGYWKQGSVCEDFAAIEAAAYAIGGWADGYTNAIPRLLEGLPGPRKGLIGPWAHAWPQAGPPEPTIGFLQETLRWWDHWLKCEDTGIMDEPMLRSWIQEPARPAACYRELPGRWVADPCWPSPNVGELRLGFGVGTLGGDPPPAPPVEFTGLQTAGWDAGSWCPYGEVADWPGDQRAMDGMSVCFTGELLAEPLEILGYPEVDIELASDRPLALVAVRLCEVFPDGASAVVTRAIQNLTHRESDEFPEALEPGRRYTVTVKLDAAGHAFAAGNRLRLGISPTYWPWAWPSPEPVTLTIHPAGSALRLPVRTAAPDDQRLAPFGPPQESPPMATEQLHGGPAGRSMSLDLATGRTELAFDWDVGGLVRMPNGIEVEDTNTTIYSIVEGDPLSAEVRCLMTGSYGRGDWRTHCETDSRMTCDARSFTVTNTLRAWEGDERVFEHTWTSVIPRDLV